MDCKIYKINGAEFTKDDVAVYIENSVDRVYAILISFESCQETNNFESYQTYLERLIVEFDGIYDLLGIIQFFSLVGILKGMQKEGIKHHMVRSATFHCISILKSVIKE